MMTFTDKADDVAKEIVSIATSDHFGDLRLDMIERAATRATIGDTSCPAPLRAALGGAIATRLGAALIGVFDAIKSGDL